MIFLDFILKASVLSDGIGLYCCLLDEPAFAVQKMAEDKNGKTERSKLEKICTLVSTTITQEAVHTAFRAHKRLHYITTSA